MCSLSASAKPSASCACNSAMKCSCSLIDSSQRLASKLASDLARRILAVRAAQVVCSTGLPASRAISAWICWFMHGTVSGIAQRTGRAMSDDKPSPRRGRKPLQARQATIPDNHGSGRHSGDQAGSARPGPDRVGRHGRGRQGMARAASRMKEMRGGHPPAARRPHAADVLWTRAPDFERVRRGLPGPRKVLPRSQQAEEVGRLHAELDATAARQVAVRLAYRLLASPSGYPDDER
jgi:hypothetical protein